MLLHYSLSSKFIGLDVYFVHCTAASWNGRTNITAHCLNTSQIFSFIRSLDWPDISTTLSDEARGNFSCSTRVSRVSPSVRLDAERAIRLLHNTWGWTHTERERHMSAECKHDFTMWQYACLVFDKVTEQLYARCGPFTNNAVTLARATVILSKRRQNTRAEIKKEKIQTFTLRLMALSTDILVQRQFVSSSRYNENIKLKIDLTKSCPV